MYSPYIGIGMILIHRHCWTKLTDYSPINLFLTPNPVSVKNPLDGECDASSLYLTSKTTDIAFGDPFRFGTQTFSLNFFQKKIVTNGSLDTLDPS